MGAVDVDAPRAFDVFFALTNDLLVVAGTDGRFRRVSASWTEALGWTGDELCAVPWLDFVHPDDHRATVDAAQSLEGGALLTHFSNRYRTRGGEWRRLYWRCVPSPSWGLIYGVARLVGRAPSSSRTAPMPSSGRHRVLLVDDEPAVALAMSRVLSGLDVTAVGHGSEALALLEAGRAFDVILSDLSSVETPPDVFHDALLRRFPEMVRRLAFVTGGAVSPEATRLLARLPNARLEKPFRPDELRSLVDGIAGG